MAELDKEMASLEKIFLPYQDPVLPYEGIFAPFEQAFFNYLVQDEKSFVEILEYLGEKAKAESSPDFLNLSFEELMKVPVTEGGNDASSVDAAGQMGNVDSVGNPLQIEGAGENAGVDSLERVTSIGQDLFHLGGVDYVQSGTITPTGEPNFAPVAVNDTYTVTQNGFLLLSGSNGFLSNDFDKNPGQPFSISGFSYQGGGVSAMSLFSSLAPVQTFSSSPAQNLNITLSLDSGALIKLLPNGGLFFDTNHAYDYLALGEIFSEKFTYILRDSSGATSIGHVTFNILGANDAPIAFDQNISAVEDGPTTNHQFDAMDIDSDETSSTLHYSIVSNLAANQGTVTNNNDGTFDYNPGSNFQSLAEGETTTVSFTYQVTDSHGAVSQVQTVTVTITGVNDAPIAYNQAINAVEDGAPVTTQFQADDVDSDNNQANLTYNIITGLSAGQGILTNNNNGTFTFNPGSDFQSLAQGQTSVFSFTYQATDSHGATSGIQTVTVTVTGVNDAPVAQNQSLTVTEDSAPTVVLFNADDIDSDNNQSNLTYNVVAGLGAGQGILTNNHNGTFTFDPGSDFQYLAQGQSTNVQFTYNAMDAHGAFSGTQTVTITVTGLNDAPVAMNDGGYNTGAYSVLSINGVSGVLANDSDVDSGSTFTVATVNGAATVGSQIVLPSGALLTVNTDGSFSYNPNGVYNYLAQGAHATDSFTYQIVDNLGAISNTATASVTITGVNPVQANNDNYVVDPSSLPKYVLTLVLDTSGSMNTIVSGGQSRLDILKEALTGTGNLLDTYFGLSSDIHVNVILFRANATLGYQADINTISDLNALKSYINSVNNSFSPDGTSYTAATNAAMNAITADNVPAYSAYQDKVYFITDGIPFPITATGNPSAWQTYITNNNVDVTMLGIGNVGDVDTQYTDPFANSTDSPKTIIASSDLSDLAQLLVGTVSFASTVLGNDITGPNGPVTVTSFTYNGGTVGTVGTEITTALGGKFVINADGTYTYKLPPGGLGAAQNEVFTYTITDIYNHNSTATLSLGTVANQLPTAVADSATVNEDSTLNVAASGLVSNDTDPEGSALAVYSVNGSTANVGTAISIGLGGLLTVYNDGSYSFNTNNAYNSLSQGQSITQTFTYQVVDPLGGVSSNATVTITVTGVNDAPVANDQSINATENGSSVTASFAADDVDSDNNQANLTYNIISGLGAGQGSVVNNNNGTFTFNPGSDFQSLAQGQTTTVNFTYQATDAHGAVSAIKTVSVVVTGVNDAPTTSNQSGTVSENGPALTLSFAGNDVDSDNSNPASLIYNIVTGIGAGMGTLVNNNNGTFTFNPGADFQYLAQGQNTVVTFTYQATDSHGATSGSSTVSLTVTGANDAPVAVNDTGNTGNYSVLSVSAASGVLLNDSDVDQGSSFTVTQVNGLNSVGSQITLSSGALLTLNANGSYTYDPNGKFNAITSTANDSFTYQITDNNGATSTATVNIAINPENPVNAVNDANVVERGFLPSYELTLVIDISGSMDTVVSGSSTRLDLVKDALNGTGNLLDNYFNQSGNLHVNIVLFKNNTSLYFAGDINNSSDLSALKTSVNGIASTLLLGGTNYDEALLRTEHVITADLPTYGSYQDVVYFFTDGNPDAGTSTAAGLSAWQTFIADNNIDVNVFAVGSVTTAYTDPIANPTDSPQTFVAAPDLSNLADALNLTIPVTTGNVLTNDSLGPNGTVIDSFTYNNGGAVGVLGSEMTTNTGGHFVLNSDGSYTYQLPASGFSVSLVENIFYTLKDSYGNTDTAKLTISFTDNTAPVVLDLNGDHNISLVSINDSQAYFDTNNDGVKDHIGWVGSNDGLLVYDYQQDGKVTDVKEFSFTSYVDGAKTDLEGLRFFDTNHDGKLDAGDAEYSKFNVWQDANGNGVVDANEMHSLSSYNIESINLSSDHQSSVVEGNIITGYTQYQTTDGNSHLAADVMLTNTIVTSIDHNEVISSSEQISYSTLDTAANSVTSANSGTTASSTSGSTSTVTSGETSTSGTSSGATVTSGEGSSASSTDTSSATGTVASGTTTTADTSNTTNTATSASGTESTSSSAGSSTVVESTANTSSGSSTTTTSDAAGVMASTEADYINHQITAPEHQTPSS